MTITVYLPFVIAPLFAVAASLLSRRLPPAPATWLLSAGALAAAGSTVLALALLASPLVAQLPGLSAEGGWSDAVLASHDPVRVPVAVVALVLLACVVVSTAMRAARHVRAFRAARRFAAGLPAQGELALLETDRPDAYAVPGRPGRIVVSPTMLRVLNGRQRRAVLAHERAHLRHRHHLHMAAARLAVAANPFLRPVRSAVARSCERWADEAAAAVAGRDVVAAALLRTGAHGATSLAVPAMAIAASDVEARIAALAEPAQRLRAWRLLVPLLLVAASALALGNAVLELHALFELAQGG